MSNDFVDWVNLSFFVERLLENYWIAIFFGASCCSFSKEMVRTPSLSSALTVPSSSFTGTGSAMVRENSPQ